MSGSDIEIDSDIEREKQALQQSVTTNDSPQAPTTTTNNDTHTNGVQPNQTIYINNINDKIKLPEIKKGLYHVFGAYGNIIEVVVRPVIKCRGQAWCVIQYVYMIYVVCMVLTHCI